MGDSSYKISKETIVRIEISFKEKNIKYLEFLFFCILYRWFDRQELWLRIVWSSFSEKRTRHNQLEFETTIQNLSEWLNFFIELSLTNWERVDWFGVSN